ncbi:MAG: hypothetical protein ACLQPN_14805 [Bryobacteraceae bacterium]
MPVVTDAAETAWTVSTILGTSALVSIFVVGAFAVITWVRMDDQISERRNSAL